MTSLMYKDGVEMEVTDDEDGRAELAKHGWTEKDESKPLSMPKVSNDDSSRNSK